MRRRMIPQSTKANESNETFYTRERKVLAANTTCGHAMPGHPQPPATCRKQTLGAQKADGLAYVLHEAGSCKRPPPPPPRCETISLSIESPPMRKGPLCEAGLSGHERKLKKEQDVWALSGRRPEGSSETCHLTTKTENDMRRDATETTK